MRDTVKVTKLPDLFEGFETVVCDGEVVRLPMPPACDPDHEALRRDAEVDLLLSASPSAMMN